MRIRWLSKKSVLAVVTIMLVVGARAMVVDLYPEAAEKPLFDGDDGLFPPLELVSVERKTMEYYPTGWGVPLILIHVEEKWRGRGRLNIQRWRFVRQHDAVNQPRMTYVFKAYKGSWDPCPTIGTHTAWFDPEVVLFVKGSTVVRISAPYNPEGRAYTDRIARRIEAQL
ncbi:MAG: hypothetical protein AB1758_30490 [Candidatus Eremiobacterota bacterium]